MWRELRQLRLRVPLELAPLLLLAGWLILSPVSVYVYHWPTSGGITVTTPVGCIGLEVYGHPGPFGGLDPGACDI